MFRRQIKNFEKLVITPLKIQRYYNTRVLYEINLIAIIVPYICVDENTLKITGLSFKEACPIINTNYFTPDDESRTVEWICRSKSIKTKLQNNVSENNL